MQQPVTTKKELRGWYIYDWYEKRLRRALPFGATARTKLFVACSRLLHRANSVYFNTVLQALLPPFLLIVATNNELEDHKFTFMGSIRLSGMLFYFF